MRQCLNIWKPFVGLAFCNIDEDLCFLLLHVLPLHCSLVLIHRWWCWCYYCYLPLLVVLLFHCIVGFTITSCYQIFCLSHSLLCCTILNCSFTLLVVIPIALHLLWWSIYPLHHHLTSGALLVHCIVVASFY